MYVCMYVFIENLIICIFESEIHASLFYLRLCITSTDCWFCDASGSPNLYTQYITYDLNFFATLDRVT